MPNALKTLEKTEQILFRKRIKRKTFYLKIVCGLKKGQKNLDCRLTKKKLKVLLKKESRSEIHKHKAMFFYRK